MPSQNESKAPVSPESVSADWRVALALWLMLGGLGVVLAHTLAMGMA